MNYKFRFEELSGECKSVIIRKNIHCTSNFKQWVHFSEKGDLKLQKARIA